MELNIKQDLASNWFKLLQDAICDDISKIEKKKIKFRSKQRKREKKKEKHRWKEKKYEKEKKYKRREENITKEKIKKKKT